MFDRSRFGKVAPWSALVTFSILALIALPFARAPSVGVLEIDSGNINNGGDKALGVCATSGDSDFWNDNACFCSRFEVDLNLWCSHVSLGQYAYINSYGTTNPPIHGHTKNIPFHWRWGGRVGYGVQFIHCDWDAFLAYTFFLDWEHGSAQSEAHSAVVPLKGVALSGTTVGAATSRMKLYWHNIDLTADKNFHFQENILVSTKLGLKNSWFGLKQNTTYSGGDILGTNKSFIHQRSDFWGIGPQIGARTRWLFTNTAYLSGGLSGALEYGINRINYNESVSNTTTSTIALGDKIKYLVPNLDLDIGLGFSDYFFDDCLFVSFDISYENHYFFRQNQMLNAEPFVASSGSSSVTSSVPRFTNESGDVSFQGFTLKLSFKY